MAAPSKKARMDFLAQITKKYVGSGDPEISDAKDVVTYLSEKYTPSEWKHLLQGLHTRLLALTGKQHQTPKSTVPDVPVRSTDDMWVMAWHLGYQEDHSYRGKPQTVHILEKAQSFLEKCFDSQNFPLKIAMPGPGAIPGEPLEDHMFKHIVGFTRCLAACVILEGAATGRLSDSQLVSLSDVLLSCLCIKATFKSYATEDEAREESLRLKFQVADSVRPTVFQIYFNLRKRVERAGKDFIAVSDEIIKSFNSATDIEGYKISALEAKVILTLPHQTETFFKTLEYHWQNFKTGESAVPLSFFDDESGLFTEILSDRKGVWAKVYEITPFKNEVALLYLIGVFLKAVKEVIRKRQKPNLRNAAQRYRVKDPKTAMKIACLWAHFRPDLIKVLSKDDFQQCEQMFFRGSFDREYTDKVNAENESLKFEDFRFMTMFKSSSHLHAAVHCPTSSGSAEGDESALQEQADDSQLALINRHLDDDQKHWDKHLQSLRDHEDAQAHSKRVHDRTLNSKIDAVAEKVQEINYPVRVFNGDVGIGTWIPSSLLAWSDDSHCPLSDTYVMYWLDLTKAGNSFKRILPLMLRVMAEAIGHKPHSTAGLVAAPLVGSRGDGADAAAADTAHDDCETIFKLPIHKLTCRRITFSYSENNQATDTWCTHPGWIVYTDSFTMDGSTVVSHCEFAKSRLCRQRGVVQLSVPDVQDRVCPSSSVPINPVNMSQGQRRLQKIGGVQFFNKVREATWANMKLTPRHGGAWVDMLGYDASLVRSVLSDNMKARPNSPKEMVVTTVTSGGDDDTDEVRKRIGKWIQECNKRELKALIKSKSLVHPDVAVIEWRSTVQCPTCDTTLLKVTMPTADNYLAIKQTSLDEWEKKIARKQEALKAITATHDKKYNPSGRTFKANNPSSSTVPRTTLIAQEDEGEPQDWPAEQVYASMDAVSDDSLEAMPGSPSQYTLHVSSTKLLIQAHEDGIVGTITPLCHVWGKYHTGTEVAAAAKKKLSLMPLNVDSMDFIAYYSGLPSWEPQFTTKPTTLSQFVDYLESHDVTDFTFVCHEVKTGTADDVEGPISVKNTEKCSFEPLAPPPKTTLSHSNIGCKIKSKIDWNTGEAKGDLCQVRFHLQYSESSQLKGISPGKPALFLKKPMRVKKGQVYAVVW